MSPSRRASSLFSIVPCLLAALTATACGSSDDATESANETTRPETDTSLCSQVCEKLPTTCPRYLADMGGDCQSACMTEDSSTEFRRCLAASKSCEDMTACKNAN